MICFYLAICVRFWIGILPLLYVKSVGRTIPLFLSFLFQNYIFVRIKLKLYTRLAWVNLQICLKPKEI